jgi:hypothetical protein
VAVVVIIFPPPGFASHFAGAKPRFAVELACAALMKAFVYAAPSWVNSIVL